MLVDLVHLPTRDGLRLEAMYQAPTANPHAPLDAVVCVHGTGSNFYGSSLFDALGERLLSLGIGVFRLNTRGHDLMCNVPLLRGGGRRLGAAYEVVEECRHDVRAAIDWLAERTGPRLGLIGHSLGAVKCLFAQAMEPDERVSAIVAISPPRLSYSWFRGSARQAEFLATLDQARQLVTAGEPGYLLDVRFPLPFVVTAAGYLEKYGPEERYNYLHFLDQITCPVLLTLGEVELSNNVAFQQTDEAVRAIAPRVSVEVVPGADHFYTGVRENLIACVEGWLTSHRSTPGRPA